MARFAALLALCLAALSASTSGSPVVIREPPVRLPLVRRFKASALEGQTLAAYDRSRAQALAARVPELARLAGTRGAPGHVGPRQISEAVTDNVVDYIANVGVGTPPTFYNLIVDTGSANTWIGAGKPYVRTTSSVDINQTVGIKYGRGSFIGSEYLDTVTLGTLVIANQSIGVASNWTDFEGVDGVLGIGPTPLSFNTTSGGGVVPTVTKNAFNQSLIPQDIVGISFEPTLFELQNNGEITFGGVDPSRFDKGTLKFVNITKAFPSSGFVGVDQVITFNDSRILASSGIIDTGTTLLLLRTGAFETYQNITGAVLDATTGLLKVDDFQLRSLKSLFFTIGDVNYEFTANAQVWPHHLNTAIGGTPDGNYLVVNDLGPIGIEGLDFINGFTWLQRFYHVYDEANGRVGLATTRFTNATTN